MAFSNAIPQPNHQLNNSQQDLLDNFIAIQNLIGINHVNFNVAGQGKHTQVTLPEEVAPVNTAIDEANIYSQNSPLTGDTELFWQRENNGDRIEWTGSRENINGWTRLPSNILIKWGTANSTGTAFPVVFPVLADTPAFVGAFFVMAVTISNNNAVVSVEPASLTTLQFIVNTFEVSEFADPIASTIAYLAIGI